MGLLSFLWSLKNNRLALKHDLNKMYFFNTILITFNIIYKANTNHINKPNNKYFRKTNWLKWNKCLIR